MSFKNVYIVSLFFLPVCLLLNIEFFNLIKTSKGDHLSIPITILRLPSFPKMWHVTLRCHFKIYI